MAHYWGNLSLCKKSAEMCTKWPFLVIFAIFDRFWPFLAVFEKKNVWNHVIYLSPMAYYRDNIALCKNNAEMCTKCAEMCKKIIFWANFGQKTHFWRTEIFFFAFFFSEMDSSWKTGYKTCALWLFTCHNYNEIKMCPSPLVITLETAVCRAQLPSRGHAAGRCRVNTTSGTRRRGARLLLAVCRPSASSHWPGGLGWGGQPRGAQAQPQRWNLPKQGSLSGWDPLRLWYLNCFWILARIFFVKSVFGV